MTGDPAMSTSPFAQPLCTIGSDLWTYAFHEIAPADFRPFFDRYFAAIHAGIPAETAVVEISLVMDRAIVLSAGGLPSEV